MRAGNDKVYRILKRLIEFANKMGNDESAASAVGKLMERPSNNMVFSTDVLLTLMNNHSKIFIESEEYDVDNSKCQPPDLRKKMQMEQRSIVECKQQ